MFLPIIKTVADVAVSIGAGAVVSNLITATTPVPRTLIQKISVTVGATTVAAATGNLAARFVREQIDTTADQVKELKETFKK